MSAVAGAPSGLGSLAGSGALAKLGARRDRVMLPAWIYVITILVVSTGYSFKGLYKTLASREALAAGINHNPGTLALAGPLYGTSVGALTAYKVGASAAVVAGLMSIFIVIRHTRADEEAGRLELVGSTAVGRNAALGAGLALAVFHQLGQAQDQAVAGFQHRAIELQQIVFQFSIQRQQLAVEHAGAILGILEPQARLDAALQLNDAERFGQIVVGTIEQHGGHLVRRCLAGKHDDFQVR